MVSGQILPSNLCSALLGFPLKVMGSSLRNAPQLGWVKMAAQYTAGTDPSSCLVGLLCANLLLSEERHSRPALPFPWPPVKPPSEAPFLNASQRDWVPEAAQGVPGVLPKLTAGS